MSTPHLRLVPAADAGEPLGDPAAAHAVAAWVHQLRRALKTCRLYDGANPMVVRFREELATALQALHASHGAIPLRVSSQGLLYAGHELASGEERGDQLAAVLHRDGIRQLTLEPGMDARELDLLLDQILQVSGPTAGDDDLVTLLWDANLPHVTLETVPLEGDADGGGESDAETRPVLAFPRQERGTAAPPPADGEQASDVSRSEDWNTGETSAPLEQAFELLHAIAPAEQDRFHLECEAAVGVGSVSAALRMVEDCFANELTDADRQELIEFVPRVLREALALGDWRASSSALRSLRQCDPTWSAEVFCRELCGPFATTTKRVVAALDTQDTHDIQTFLELAREFGPPLGEWFMHVLAESDQMRVRRPLARVIAELLADRHEVLRAWADDKRWYVVRNVVHILGWIGGDRIAATLDAVSGHPELRVRREVIAALNDVHPERSRPILVRMLRDAEPKLFGTILHQLCADAHPSIADVMLGLFQDEGFALRSEDERRAFFIALATRGDAVVPALETALNEGGLFSRRPEPDRAAIALCLARIGTPAARAILERGLKSSRASIRRACLIAGASGDTKHE